MKVRAYLLLPRRENCINMHTFCYLDAKSPTKQGAFEGLLPQSPINMHTFCYPGARNTTKQGAFGKPACTKSHKYAYFLRPWCKKGSKTGAFDAFMQKCPQNTCPAECGTADGRGHIPIGPAPKLRKTKQNNT